MKRKIYKKHIYLYLVILLFSISCNESEKEIDLGSSFYYIPFQETIFDVTTFGGNGIYEYRNNLKVPVVLPDIENYKYDSDFIIVKQNFNLEQATRLIQSMLFMPNLYFSYDKKYIELNENYLSKLDDSQKNSIYARNFTSELLKISTSTLKMESNQENYYIIEKKESKINGPLSKSEFIKLKESLEIDIDFE